MSGSITALKAGPQCLLDAHDAEIGRAVWSVPSFHTWRALQMDACPANECCICYEGRSASTSSQLQTHYLHRPAAERSVQPAAPCVGKTWPQMQNNVTQGLVVNPCSQVVLRGWFRVLNLGHRGLPAAGASNCSRPASGRIQLLHGPSSAGPG